MSVSNVTHRARTGGIRDLELWRAVICARIDRDSDNGAIRQREAAHAGARAGAVIVNDASGRSEHRQAEIHRVSAGCRDVQAEPDEGGRKPAACGFADGKGRCQAVAPPGLVRRPHRGDAAPLRHLFGASHAAKAAAEPAFAKTRPVVQASKR
jgi:hypothetical protein